MEPARKCRHSLSLPVYLIYGRGRIIGDYSYGVDALIADKTNQKMALAPSWTIALIRHRRELPSKSVPLRNLLFGEIYGFDLSRSS